MPKSVQTVSAPAKPAASAAARKVASKKAAPQQAAATTGKASPPAVANSDVAKSALAKSNSADATTVPETAGSAPVNAPMNTTNGAQANTAEGEGKTTAMAHAGDVSAAAPDAAAPRCDVQACSARYHSFSASDCTYQPFDGPRRLCTVGHPPGQANAATTGVRTSDARQPPASSSCNVDACGAAYRSFDPATCTYQPLEGPRRLCAK